MKSDKKLLEIVLNIYQEMYNKASPKANFKELMKKGITKQPNWFMDYILDEAKQMDIIDKHCKKNKLTKREKEKIHFTVMLGCSPRFAEKDFE